MNNETRRSPQAAPRRIVVNGQAITAFSVRVKIKAVRGDDYRICPGGAANGTGICYEFNISPNQPCRPSALDDRG
jgi:hypothetical protein